MAAQRMTRVEEQSARVGARSARKRAVRHAPSGQSLRGVATHSGEALQSQPPPRGHKREPAVGCATAPAAAQALSEPVEVVDREADGTDEHPQEPPIELAALRDRQRDIRPGPGHHHVTFLLPGHRPPGTLESPNRVGARDERQLRQGRSSDGDFDDLDALRRQNGAATLLLHLEPALDRLPDAGHGYLTHTPLARAARQRRALGHHVAVLARVNESFDDHASGVLALAPARPKRRLRPGPAPTEHACASTPRIGRPVRYHRGAARPPAARLVT